MQKNTPLETMYMEYANTVKHFLISLCGNFDLAEDPHELKDLISDSSRRERIQFLRSCLIQSLKDRPEGFTDGERLIAGRDYPPTMDCAEDI